MQNRIIYANEVDQLLRSLDAPNEPERRFNRAVIGMAVGCGLEPSELSRITREQIYRTDYEVYERSYIPASISVNDRDRPLGLLWPTLRNILYEYRQFIFENKIYASDSDMDLERPLFCKPDGSAFPAWSTGDNRMSSRPMSRLIQSLINRSPLVDSGVTPKSLRHSFVVALFEHGIRHNPDTSDSQLSELTGYSCESIGNILLRAPSRYSEPLNSIFKVRKRKRKPL